MVLNRGDGVCGRGVKYVDVYRVSGLFSDAEDTQCLCYVVCCMICSQS